MPPGAAPTTPLLDNFNRADSGSLGPNWSSPAVPGENSLKIGANQAQIVSPAASSYWNTLIDASGGVEAVADLVNSAGNDNSQLIIGLTSVGNGYRFVCDKPGDQYRLVRMVNGVDTTLATNNGATAAAQRLWAYMEPSGTTGVQIWCFDWNGSAWVQQINITDTFFGKIGPQYIGLRASANSWFDNFMGGSYGIKGTSVPAVASLTALSPTPSKAATQPVPPSISTLTAIGPGQTMAPQIGPAAMNLIRGTQGSQMKVNVPFGTQTVTRLSPSGHSDVPAFPPIPQPPPPPPPPPPDPRDVPALDGPWTYLMYEAMQPLTWADESLGWPMLNFFKAIAYNYHEPYAFAVDPGWQLALDVDEVPSWWLNWLAQFVGISLLKFQLLANQDKRDTIKDAPGWHRGTKEAMIKAAQSTLSGNKTVIVYERYDPSFGVADRAYHITFITYQSETPNQNLTLQALIAAKPGGLQLSLLSRAGQIWQWLRDHYPPTTQRTWAQVKSEYADWEHARDVTYY